MIRRIDTLLSEYGESHRNPVNKGIHWVCVPLIAWSLMALLWSLPVPGAFSGVAGLNWLTIILAPVLVYYLVLSPTLAVGFFFLALIGVALIRAYETSIMFPLWEFALVLFVLGWVGQFLGHAVEGNRPSFFKDIRFLLIGPAWLLHLVYRWMNVPY